MEEGQRKKDKEACLSGYLLVVGCSFNFCIHVVPYLPGCVAF
jgi:hypothetical protein